MKATATKTISKQDVMDKFIEVVSMYSWNTTSQQYTILKVVKGLMNKNLMATIETDYERLKKDNSVGYMKSFYDGIKEVNFKYFIDENSKEYLDYLEEQMFPHKNTYKDQLTETILKDNYYGLKKAKLMDYLYDFSGYFSGDFKKVYRVGDTDIIIFEFHQKPFSNERQYHWDEPDKKKFYNNKNTNHVFETFERCLMSAMFKHHYGAADALYESANKEQ